MKEFDHDFFRWMRELNLRGSPVYSDAFIKRLNNEWIRLGHSHLGEWSKGKIEYPDCIVFHTRDHLHEWVFSPINLKPVANRSRTGNCWDTRFPLVQPIHHPKQSDYYQYDREKDYDLSDFDVTNVEKFIEYALTIIKPVLDDKHRI